MTVSFSGACMCFPYGRALNVLLLSTNHKGLTGSLSVDGLGLNMLRMLLWLS